MLYSLAWKKKRIKKKTVKFCHVLILVLYTLGLLEKTRKFENIVCFNKKIYASNWLGKWLSAKGTITINQQNCSDKLYSFFPREIYVTNFVKWTFVIKKKKNER